MKPVLCLFTASIQEPCVACESRLRVLASNCAEGRFSAVIAMETWERALFGSHIAFVRGWNSLPDDDRVEAMNGAAAGLTLHAQGRRAHATRLHGVDAFYQTCHTQQRRIRARSTGVEASAILEAARPVRRMGAEAIAGHISPADLKQPRCPRLFSQVEADPTAIASHDSRRSRFARAFRVAGAVVTTRVMAGSSAPILAAAH